MQPVDRLRRLPLPRLGDHPPSAGQPREPGRFAAGPRGEDRIVVADAGEEQPAGPEDTLEAPESGDKVRRLDERNPGSATPASLRIAYQNDQDVWASLQPDFIVVSRRSDGTLGASIVDPHGDHLADARAKIRALAAFAEQFGDQFVRIESVAKVEDGSLRVLDLSNLEVRAEVLAFQGGQVTALYQSEQSRPYT
jgi:hypothetical protein